MMSFERTYNADGWRHSVTHRTRPESQSDGTVMWVVQSYRGPEQGWVFVGRVGSYAGARALATADWNKRVSHHS